MAQLWPGLHKLRKSTLEVFPYQINSGASTTNHRVEQKCDGDSKEQKMGTGNRHPALSVSPGVGIPFQPFPKNDLFNSFGQVTSLQIFYFLS